MASENNTQRRGVRAREFFYCEEPDHCTLRMSYVSTTEENLIEAVKRLKISLN